MTQVVLVVRMDLPAQHILCLGPGVAVERPATGGTDRDTAGAAFHTARWDPDQDLTDRDVAVIGTGSSAAQLLPHVARQAKLGVVHGGASGAVG